MRRNHISCLWIVLLCLLPILTDAQTLSRYEYWFDDDIGSKQWGSLSGTDDEVNLAIDVTQLDNGIHKFSFRVRQSDGMYSAIRSSIFLKTTPGEATRLEYWIDGDISTRKLFDGQRISDGDYIINDSLDLSDVSPGVHRLFLRGRGPNTKVVSAVTSVPIFVKQTMPQGNKVVYWIDDNYDQKEIVDFDSSLDVNSLDLDMADNVKYPVGYHRLNMRVDLEGQGKSAVFTDGFFKSPTGQATQLEYWIDGDIRTRKLFDGQSVSGGDYIINDFLDLSELTPGTHRLFLRGRGPNTKIVSAVTSTPIMVKSRYNVENPESLTVTEQAYWFDDEEPKISLVAYPKNVINQPNTFDTRRLTDGQHTLHTQFANSAGVWNVPVDFTFVKKKVGDPLIEANATEEDGIVTLKYNTIPFGYNYKVIRQYPSGKKRIVDFNESTEYPAPFQAIDFPGPGTYTYYIEGKYTDVDGVEQVVRSGDMNVTVAKAASTVGNANIHCLITHDGERISQPFNTEYKVYLNGERISESDYTCRYGTYGEFTIERVPYGSEITIGIQEKFYAYKDLQLIVNENTSHGTYFFNGNSNENFLPDNSIYDLILYDLQITPSGWEIAIQNKSNLSWSGDILISVISKKVKDKYDKKIKSDDSTDEAQSPKASYEDSPLYTNAALSSVSLGGYEYKVFTLDITDLPEKDKCEDYYVYVFSQKTGTELMKKLEGGSPQVLEFNPFDFGVAEQKGFMSYMKSYKEVMKWMKKFSAWGDPLTLAWNSCGTAFDDYIKTLDKEEEGFSEINEDVADAAIRSAGMLLNCFFSDLHKSVKKYKTMVKENGLYVAHEKMQTLYELIDGAYNTAQADDYHKYFELAKLVFKLTEKWEHDPVVSLYKTYFEVGAAMASGVEQLANKVSSFYVWERLSKGNGIYKIKVRRYSSSNRWEGYFRGKDFYQEKGSNNYHAGQIRSIKIELLNPEYENSTYFRTESKSFDVELEDDGITISNVQFTNAMDFYTATEAWMTIIWNNNLVTRIPLLDENFTKLENRDADVSIPLIMTVELQSEANLHLENLANKLTIVKP